MQLCQDFPEVVDPGCRSLEPWLGMAIFGFTMLNESCKVM